MPVRRFSEKLLGVMALLPAEKLDSNACYADVETSSEGYARRFSGPVGQWLLTVQESAVASLLGPSNSRTLLDVGGGHAQLAQPLSSLGYKVTVLGSQQVCATRLTAWLGNQQGKFVVGEILNLPFADKSFDIVLSVRLISHCPEWKRLISELARVAAGEVVIDFPPLFSCNLFYNFLFFLKRSLEGNTRSFLIFSEKELVSEFTKHGFKLNGRRKQFFFPMVLHRVLKNHSISALLESIAAVLGLTALFGSPTVIRMKRER